MYVSYDNSCKNVTNFYTCNMLMYIIEVYIYIYIFTYTYLQQ